MWPRLPLVAEEEKSVAHLPGQKWVGPFVAKHITGPRQYTQSSIRGDARPRPEHSCKPRDEIEVLAGLSERG